MTTATDSKPAGFGPVHPAPTASRHRIPAVPEVEAIPLRGTGFAATYGVRLTSIGPYRIFGYLSIPTGEGPFPAKCFLPRYGSVVDLVPQGTSNRQRGEYVTFSICARGQRRADEPYAAAFPGMLTDGIDDAASYVYRGIAADCCRGLEYLAGRPEVDETRIAAVGADLALITAALGTAASCVVSAPTLLFRTADLAARTSAYPLEEINDYLRLHPEREAQVRDTLSYFDLRWFAPRVTARTLVVAGPDGTALDAAALEPLTGAIREATMVYHSQHSGFKDGVFTEKWLARELGLAAPVLPPHWQS